MRADYNVELEQFPVAEEILSFMGWRNAVPGEAAERNIANCVAA